MDDAPMCNAAELQPITPLPNEQLFEPIPSSLQPQVNVLAPAGPVEEEALRVRGVVAGTVNLVPPSIIALICAVVLASVLALQICNEFNPS